MRSDDINSIALAFFMQAEAQRHGVPLPAGVSNEAEPEELIPLLQQLQIPTATLMQDLSKWYQPWWRVAESAYPRIRPLMLVAPYEAAELRRLMPSDTASPLMAVIEPLIVGLERGDYAGVRAALDLIKGTQLVHLSGRTSMVPEMVEIAQQYTASVRAAVAALPKTHFGAEALNATDMKRLYDYQSYMTGEEVIDVTTLTQPLTPYAAGSQYTDQRNFLIAEHAKYNRQLPLVLLDDHRYTREDFEPAVWNLKIDAATLARDAEQYAKPIQPLAVYSRLLEFMTDYRNKFQPLDANYWTTLAVMWSRYCGMRPAKPPPAPDVLRYRLYKLSQRRQPPEVQGLIELVSQIVPGVPDHPLFYIGDHLVTSLERGEYGLVEELLDEAGLTDGDTLGVNNPVNGAMIRLLDRLDVQQALTGGQWADIVRQIDEANAGGTAETLPRAWLPIVQLLALATELHQSERTMSSLHGIMAAQTPAAALEAYSETGEAYLFTTRPQEPARPEYAPRPDLLDIRPADSIAVQRIKTYLANLLPTPTTLLGQKIYSTTVSPLAIFLRRNGDAAVPYIQRLLPKLATGPAAAAAAQKREQATSGKPKARL